jgi:uncharacterized Zn finger protein (UPF0148 family)
VNQDQVFLCDHHWIWCQHCGTGMFVGISHVYCPACDRQAMKENCG